MSTASPKSAALSAIQHLEECNGSDKEEEKNEYASFRDALKSMRHQFESKTTLATGQSQSRAVNLSHLDTGFARLLQSGTDFQPKRDSLRIGAPFSRLGLGMADRLPALELKRPWRKGHATSIAERYAEDECERLCTAELRSAAGTLQKHLHSAACHLPETVSDDAKTQLIHTMSAFSKGQRAYNLHPKPDWDGGEIVTDALSKWQTAESAKRAKSRLTFWDRQSPPPTQLAQQLTEVATLIEALQTARVWADEILNTAAESQTTQQSGE